LQVVVSENGVRETYSARYYNPNTGRFLSRDPEDGVAHDPKTLHKYLYAGGDPVNKVDPLGRLIVDEAYLDAQDAAEAKAVAATGERVVKILDCAAALLGAAIAYHEDSFWGSVAGGFGSGIACGIWLFL
jgi:RHS repeat-associated protein